MIQTKLFTYSFLALLFLASCAGQKEVVNIKNAEGDEVVIGNVAKGKGSSFTETEIFHNAITAKTLDENEKALALFKEVLKINPKNAAAQFEIAKLLLEEKKIAEASAYANQAVKLDPSNIWYEKLQAEIFNYQGNYVEAINIYKKLVDKYPYEPQFYFELANLYERTQQYKEAIKTYDGLTDLIGVEENISFIKEKLYLRLKDVEGAAREIRLLINAYPNDSRFYGMLAELYEKNNQQDKALEVYQELIKKDPDNPYASLALADYYRKQGDKGKYQANINNAFANPELGIDIKVGFLLEYVNKVGQDENLKAEALKLAELMTQAHPDDAKAYAMYGDLLFAADELDKALEQYEKSLEKNNGIFSVWQQLMLINSDLQRYDKLAEVSQEAMELFPNQPVAYFFNGFAKNQLKKHESAINVLDQALLMSSTNKQLTAEIYANLGEAYQATKQYEKADNSYDKSLELNPNNPYVLNNYSYYLSLRKNNLEKAAELAKKANDLSPNNSAFEDTYGWVLYQQGNYDEAKNWIGKALKNGGNESDVILEHYGDALFKLGKVNEAVEYWQKALDKGGDPSDLQRKIRDRQIYE